MRKSPANDREGPWIALLCTGVLLTALAATVCLGMIVLYSAKLGDVQPILAVFAAGAALVLGAAARLDRLAVQRPRIHRR